MIDQEKNQLLVTTFKTTRAAAVVKRSSFNEFDIHKAADQLSPYLTEDEELLERLSSGKIC